MARKIGPTDRITVGGKSTTVADYLARKGGDREAALRGLSRAISSGRAGVEWDESKHPRAPDGKFTFKNVNGEEIGEMDLPFPPSAYGTAKVHEIVKAQIAAGIEPKGATIFAKDFRALRATQGELKPFGPGLDDEVDRTPLFAKYVNHPVVLEGNDGNYHVLDGHNRISAAVQANRDIAVYLFREWSKPKR
jgi:hypothetical protein